MGVFLQDLRFAVRSFAKAPAFPLAAIATLALGIGATTAIFSTLNAVLLKPLPYPHAEDLYSLRTTLVDGRVTTGLLSGGEIYRLNDPTLSIERAASFQPGDLTLMNSDGTPQHVKVYGVSEGYFELFGLPMTTGGFAHDDFAFIPPPPPPPPNAPPAPPQPPPPPPRVVISYRIWQSLYGKDPAVVGKPITFAEIPVATTVAGVAPQDFDMPHGADFWFALRTPPNDVNHGNEGFMRLKPGTTIDRAKSEMATVMAGLAREFPASDYNRVYVPKPLVDSIVGDLGPILIIVMSATGLLLLLACVNVTNLLLARGSARAREMAVRVSLGAGRGRIVRQLLTESVLLSSAGALFGVLVASLGVRALLALGASKLPRLDVVTFDARVLLFALGALLVTGLVVGFAPALRLARTDVRTLLNESGRSNSGGRVTARWLSVMTVAEIALAIMLVASAGWLVRGFANLRNINAGFNPSQRLIFDVAFQGQRYRNGDAVHAARNDMLDAIRALHGVTAAGATSAYPMRGTLENSLILQIHGETMDPSNPMGSRQRFVTAGLFTAMGTKLEQGRDFGAGDLPNTDPTVIVNRTFVRRYLSNRDPIGVKFAAGYPAPNPAQEVTIVGVVDDIRQKSLDLEAEPAFYSPLSQVPLRRITMVVSTSLADVGPLEAQIRDLVRKQDPQMAVDFELASDVVYSTISRQQLGMTLMLIFGSVAVILAAVGIYGVVAYANSQRRDELATRLALGSTPLGVFWLVMRQGGALALIGTAIGLATAYLSGRVVSSQVYAIRASDPLMLTAAVLLVVGIATLATMIPAWRASRLSPARVLHPE
ncbi:MAG TPA: ABC transporter permease [Vicinamibacterales bacterium]|nr:ABC transporter permease [Vicinamibacterales bacterium]